jgi:hypothetical protein
MTRADKPTTRLTYSLFRGREIAVTIHPTWLSLRRKGERRTYTLDIEAAYSLSVKAEVESKRREKATAKKAAKKAAGGKR